METLVRIRLMVLILMTALGVVVWLPAFGSAEAEMARTTLLQVHFLDVGQGDAILIETPDGVQVLIDGGHDKAVLQALSNVMSFSDRTIDLVLATHPDSDHIGGLVDVLERFDVGGVVLTENKGDSPTAAAFSAATAAENAAVYHPRAGEVIQLGASTTLEILFPPVDVSVFETNLSSIIAQLQYGEVEFMLTGDAPQSIEEYLVREHGSALESEVLKVGHHGSKTSTAPEFLAAVAPTYAVISAGADNRYGHPHPEVVTRLETAGVVVSQTADIGTVTFYSDGERVWSE